jgi:hypothetical protein
MKLVREMVRKFFEDYERGVNASDHELPSAKYNDLFVFVSPHGVQVIKKDDFVKVVPKRHGFLGTVGLLEPRDGRAACPAFLVTAAFRLGHSGTRSRDGAPG